MEAASATVGIISFGLQAIQGIIKYYDSLQSANADVKHALKSASSVEEILNFLGRHLQSSSLDAILIDTIHKHVTECLENFQRLRRTASKIYEANPNGLKDRAKAVGKRALYPLREHTLVKIKEECNEVKSNLNLSLHMLQM